jgi:hypothetical protein
MSYFKSFIIGCLLIQCIALTQGQLDASELTAVQAFFEQFQDTLSNSLYAFPTWTSNADQACSGSGGISWGGITCTDGHITFISLPNIPLNGPLPNEVVGFTWLRSLDLRSSGISGTLPVGMEGMTNLTSLNLRANRMNLCAHEPSVPPSLVACELRDQSFLLCGLECCGCNGNWSTTACTTNVEQCGTATCSAPAPVGPQNAVCQGDTWYIPSGYSGSLIAQGAVQVMGNLDIGRNDVFITIGMSTSIAVNGKASILAFPIVYVTDSDIATLKQNRFAYNYQTILTTTDSTSTLPRALATHARRHCLRPYGTLSGDVTSYQLGLRYRTTCSTWWIMLLCILPSVIGGLLAGILPFCLK